MPEILFVDDDQRLLDGLARMLRAERRRWTMTFCLGGRAAIEMLAERSFDVLVCDMRMPDVDGLTVLRYAREHAPRTARIILSGQTEMNAVTHAVTTMHQFLSKPCEPEALRLVIERVTALQSLLSAPELRDAVGRLGRLPTLPQTYEEFAAALDAGDASIAAIVRIIEKDVALSARCLQLANSAYFGLRSRVESVRQAVSYLGLMMLRDLVLSCSVFSALRVEDRLSAVGLERLESHAVCIANVARELHTDPDLRQQAFIGGMLHDIGWIVAAECGISDDGTGDPDSPLGPMCNPHETMPDLGAQSEAPVAEAFGRAVTHSELGAYLLGLWGLPHTIIEAAAFHHEPYRVASQQFDVLASVFTAHELVKEHQQRRLGLPVDDTALVEYLGSIGVADCLPDYRSRVAAVLGR